MNLKAGEFFSINPNRLVHNQRYVHKKYNVVDDGALDKKEIETPNAEEVNVVFDQILKEAEEIIKEFSS